MSIDGFELPKGSSVSLGLRGDEVALGGGKIGPTFTAADVEEGLVAASGALRKLVDPALLAGLTGLSGTYGFTSNMSRSRSEEAELGLDVFAFAGATLTGLGSALWKPTDDAFSLA